MVYHAQQGPVWGVVGLLREDNAIPLYGLLLALWVRVMGSGEFVVRYLSVLLGTLAVPLILRLGALVARRPQGGWGAALAYATLPIYVYYTQEVRMYALVIPLAAAFAWRAWQLLLRGQGVLTYVMLGTCMMLAHLYAGLLWVTVVLSGGLMLLLKRFLGSANKRPIATLAADISSARTWWRANIYLCCVALPIAVWALWRARIDATATSAIPPSTLRWILVLFGVGQYLPSPWTYIFVLVVGLSLLVGLISLLRRGRLAGAVWIVLGLVLPLLLLLGMTWIKAKWSERYLLPSFGLALVVGVGAGWEALLNPLPSIWRPKTKFPVLMARVGGGFLLALWCSVTLWALARQAAGTWALGVVDEWHPRPDFRGVAHYIAANDTAEDVIVVVGGYAAHTLAYYYDGPARIFGLPLNTRLLDTSQALDLRALEVLEHESQDAHRLWLVLWQDHLADPTSLVQSSLVERCERLPVTRHFTNVALLHFDLSTCRPLDRDVVPPHSLNLAFRGEPLRLTGYEISRAGATWEVDLWWQATGTVIANYKVFVHLIDVQGAIVAQHDHIAGADAYPTQQWRPGTRLRDRFFLQVPGGTCRGCELHVGLYTDQGRLSLADGVNFVEIPIRVSP